MSATHITNENQCAKDVRNLKKSTITTKDNPKTMHEDINRHVNTKIHKDTNRHSRQNHWPLNIRKYAHPH